MNREEILRCLFNGRLERRIKRQEMENDKIKTSKLNLSYSQRNNNLILSRTSDINKALT